MLRCQLQISPPLNIKPRNSLVSIRMSCACRVCIMCRQTTDDLRIHSTCCKTCRRERCVSYVSLRRDTAFGPGSRWNAFIWPVEGLTTSTVCKISMRSAYVVQSSKKVSFSGKTLVVVLWLRYKTHHLGLAAACLVFIIVKIPFVMTRAKFGIEWYVISQYSFQYRRNERRSTLDVSSPLSDGGVFDLVCRRNAVVTAHFRLPCLSLSARQRSFLSDDCLSAFSFFKCQFI